ncbi:hypothetical protein Avbf_13478 [Armadillidium vulgare]|nr:hypothetical protein Avbf_13478 [Armadillidium vulgare]
MALERCVTIYRFQRKLRPKRLFSPIKTLSYMVFLWIFAMAAQTLTLTENLCHINEYVPPQKQDHSPYHASPYLVSCMCDSCLHLQRRYSRKRTWRNEESNYWHCFVLSLLDSVRRKQFYLRRQQRKIPERLSSIF